MYSRASSNERIASQIRACERRGGCGSAGVGIRIVEMTINVASGRNVQKMRFIFLPQLSRLSNFDRIFRYDGLNDYRPVRRCGRNLKKRAAWPRNCDIVLRRDEEAMSNGIVRRPAVPPPVRVRRDVSKLTGDPILV